MDSICASLAFIDGLGTPEMMLIFVIVLVLFGGHKLPEFARGLGKTMREFKKAASGVEEEFKRALEEDERKSNAAQLAAASATPQLLPASETPAHDEHGYGGGPTPASTADAGTPTATATAPAATSTTDAAASTAEPAATPAATVESTPATPAAPSTPPPPPAPKRVQPNPAQLPDYL